MPNKNFLQRMTSKWTRAFCLTLLAGLCVFAWSGVRAADDSPPSAYRRQIVRDGGLTYYVVGPRAPHLFMISRDVYGDEHRWQDIAKWNDLKAPYTLKPGQRLALKENTTLTDSQANRQLVVAWSNLQQYETVERIILSEKNEKSVEVTVTTTTTTATASPSPTPTPTPVLVPEPVMSPTPPPSPTPVVAPIATPVATPEPVVATPTPEEKGTEIVAAPVAEKAAEEPAERESRWHLALAPIASVARLHSEFNDTGIKNTLNTDVDYGVDGDISYRWNEADEVSFGFGAEHMDVRRPSDGTEIEGESQNLAHFSLGINHEVNHVSSLQVAFIEDQEAFSRPTSESAEVVTVYIPQIMVGGQWRLIHHPKFGLALNADGLILLPTRGQGFEFEMGYGGLVGLNFENEFNHGKLIYGVSFRYLNQEAINTKTWQEMALVKLGWEF